MLSFINYYIYHFIIDINKLCAMFDRIDFSLKSSEFPSLIIGKLSAHEHHADQLQMINITFNNVVYFNDEIVDDFFSYLVSHFPNIKVKFFNIKNIQKSTVISLITNKDCLTHLNDLTLIDLIPLSEESVRYALSNSEIKNRLDKVQKNPHEQTFSFSCSAISIMNYLIETNKISKDDFTSSKELEIYSQIWKAPGEEADLNKIIQFCYKNNINIIGIDVKDFRKKYLSNEKSAPMNFMFNFFRKSFKNNYVQLNSSDLNFDPFKTASKLLLIVESDPENTHVVYVSKSKNNNILVIDSAEEGSVKVYSCWKDLLSEQKKFTGIGLGLTNSN
ncbi:MAG: hypothetical protein ACD_46C00485G0004 [uncultured bacterium]|nr:MAG: hypothetical protein ACD_46C00485G0004 [uncultured bacterium]